MAKLTTLEQLRLLADRVKSEDDALAVKIGEVASDVEGIIATGGEANILEGVKVNGQALAIADKMVDILIEAGEENGTISVNGAAVAITGLQALAYKSQISESDLDEALKAAIAAAVTQTDLDALKTELEGTMQELIANAGHAHFEKVDTVPTAEEAEENVMYLVMNETTGHYDIYALVGEEVELLDDTTVDLSNYYDKEEIDAKLEGYATDEEAASAAAAAVEAATASDTEVTSMLDEVFGSEA